MVELLKPRLRGNVNSLILVAMLRLERLLEILLRVLLTMVGSSRNNRLPLDSVVIRVIR